MPSTRRTFLAVGGGALAGLAGCTNRNASTDSPSRSPSETGAPTPSPEDGDRPTQTPRDPKPLDVGGAWPQRGFDAGHAGVTDATGVPTDGEAYWHLKRIRSGPAVLADGRLFHYAKLGTDPSGTPTVTRTRATPGGTAHHVYGEPALFARDASDGRILWTREVPYRGGWPPVADGHVVVAGKGVVAAFRTSDGREAWRHDLGERQATASTAIDGTVLVSTQFVREGARDPDVRAYRATDGGQRWKRPSPKWQASLAAVGDTVLALSSQFQIGSVLTARSLTDGSERWRVELDDNGIPGGPLIAGGTAYVAPDDDGVYAFDLSDGAERWHYEAATTNRVGAAASDDEAYLVDDGRLAAVAAADGSERWSVSSDGDRRYRGTPAVGQDTIYLEKGGLPADFVALARSDGSERWRYRLPETTVEGDMVMSGLAAQPTVADGAVYAYAVDGLYAFGPDER